MWLFTDVLVKFPPDIVKMKKPIHLQPWDSSPEIVKKLFKVHITNQLWLGRSDYVNDMYLLIVIYWYLPYVHMCFYTHRLKFLFYNINFYYSNSLKFHLCCSLSVLYGDRPKIQHSFLWIAYWSMQRKGCHARKNVKFNQHTCKSKVNERRSSLYKKNINIIICQANLHSIGLLSLWFSWWWFLS